MTDLKYIVIDDESYLVEEAVFDWHLALCRDKDAETERCAKIAERFGRMSSGWLLAEKIRSVKSEGSENGLVNSAPTPIPGDVKQLTVKNADTAHMNQKRLPVPSVKSEQKP